MSVPIDCQKLADEFIVSNDKLREMLKSKDGTELWTVQCKACVEPDEKNARAYITNDSEVILCNNRLKTKEKIEEALNHEAVHAYDFTNNRCDFNTCEGVAYSEIRAARNAECSGYYPFEWLRNSCIKATATNATGNIFPRAASKCVKSVFKAAVVDISPYPPKDTS